MGRAQLSEAKDERCVRLVQQGFEDQAEEAPVALSPPVAHDDVDRVTRESLQDVRGTTMLWERLTRACQTYSY